MTRCERERPSLQGLPSHPFDTSWRIYRKVNKDCTVRFEGNSYVDYRLRGKVGKECNGPIMSTGWLTFHDRKWLNLKRPLTKGEELPWLPGWGITLAPIPPRGGEYHGAPQRFLVVVFQSLAVAKIYVSILAR